MASVEECEQAMGELAAKLSGSSGADVRKKVEDRSISCEIKDLKVVFAGQLKDGALQDIRRTDSTKAQIRLAMTSDDLLAMTNGDLPLAKAWATGKLKISASVFDLMKLRTLL